MSSLLKPIIWFYHEFGLAAIHKTGRNAYLIIVMRLCRMLAHGAITLVLGTSNLMSLQITRMRTRGPECLI
jgi:ABC-type uncharacterized transport system permease subunit